MNIQKIAQDFNQREGRAMEWKDAYVTLSSSRPFFDPVFYKQLAELLAESVRLFEREKADKELADMKYGYEYRCEELKMLKQEVVDFSIQKRNEKDKEISELKERLNNIVDRSGNVW